MISLSYMICSVVKRKINSILILSLLLIAFPALLLAQKKTAAGELKDSLDNKKVIDLHNVNIYNRKPKIKKTGTSSFTPMVWTTATNPSYELAHLIAVDRPTKLISVNVLCGGKKSEDSVTYRLNIYRVKNGYPGSKLVEKVFIKKFPVVSKKLSFDLRPEDIILTEDIAVSLQYVPEQDPGKHPIIRFRAKLNEKDSFRKETKDGQWKKAEGGCAAIYVEVEE